MHRTHIPLQKWFAAIYLIVTIRLRLTARGLAKFIGVNKDTAWRIISRIKFAQLEQQELLLQIAHDCEVKVDHD